MDEASLELFELGALGIEERDSTTLLSPAEAGAEVMLVASFADDEGAGRAARALPKRYRARLAHVVGDDWRDSWRRYFRPTRIGRRLVVCPSWETTPLTKGEVLLTVDPGRAFGTGTHASTRLVLREVDRRIHGGETVLDVGAGSGILSIAALLLGAKRAKAIDVEADSISMTVENARRNRVARHISASLTPIEKVRGLFDVVLANIEAHVLIPLAAPIENRVAHGGILVLSGILREHLGEVLDAYGSLEHVATPFEGEWVAPVFRRPSKGRKR